MGKRAEGIGFQWNSYLLKKILYLIFLIPVTSWGQSGLCDPNTPFFSVNLAGNPGGTWTSSPPVQRNGNCCGTSAPDKCIEFEITLDPTAVAINFQIASGAIPPGAMYYQIGCGPAVPVGSPICVDGAGPHILTFCKPGNNQNTYSITSIPGPDVTPDVTTSDGCTVTMGSSGLELTSITWNSIYPGVYGQYNTYLSCQSGCNTTQVLPQPGYPSYVDYVICGLPAAGPCSSTNLFCDTIRANFIDPIGNTINPNPASFCIDQPGVDLTGIINGGLAPYSFSWTNSSNIVVGNSLTYFATSPGIYSLEVRDATYPNCPPKLTSVNVTVHPLPSVNAGTDKTICPGNPNVVLNGSVLNATGGIWSGGNGTFSPSNTTLNATYTPTAAELASGSVTLTLTTTGTGACNPVSDQITINITAPLTVTIPPPSIVCYGATTNLTPVVTGGTMPYTYLWNTGNQSQTLNNIGPGTYSVTVTDATINACSSTATVTITENPELTVSAPSNSIISCDTAVIISISAQGGAGTYSYLWNTGATTPSILVNSGTYIITAFDNVGCSAKDTIVLIAANTSIAVSINNPPVLCSGTSTTLNANASGGFGGYSYDWSQGSTTNSITVGAGNYCVTLSDSVGCLVTSCIEVMEDPLLTVSIPTPPLICYGSTTSISANVSGGQAPYSYLWNTGDTTASIIKPAGSYNVTVTDANNFSCVANANVLISQATILNASATSTSVSCFGGNNGTATVNPSGSVGPYSYVWSPIGGTGQTAYGLNAGTYSVNITDALGCTKSINVQVTQPAILNATISSTSNISCFGGNNGSASVLVTGGTMPYSYLWSQPGTNQSSISGLMAGTHSVSITDAKGCYTSATFTLTEPEVLALNSDTSTNVSCYGGSDGTALVTATGGTGPYSFEWLETGDFTNSVQGLPAGTYNVSITDSNGCNTVTTGAVITQPIQLNSTVSSSNVRCYNGNNGTAFVNVIGGTLPYTYNWTPTGGSDSIASGLTAGTYSILVTDANGCTIAKNITITQPPLLSVSSLTHTDVSCFAGADGTASAAATGGTIPYTFSWSTGATTPVAGSLSAGTYSILISDANGCFTDTSFVSINQPVLLEVTTTSTNVLCYGENNGSAQASVTGGTAPYTYLWSNNTSIATTTNLIAGSYTITVTDSRGCITSSTAIINEPLLLESFINSVTNVSCYGGNNGSAIVVVSGGTQPYNYSWSSGAIGNDTASGLSAGSYTAHITDANGCVSSISTNITQPSDSLNGIFGTSNVSCFNGSDGTAWINATGGTAPYNYSWSTSALNDTVNGLQAGNYTVEVTDANACTFSETIIITEPPILQVTIPSHSNVSCHGGNNGSATAAASGGTAPYTYSWSNSAGNNSTVSNLTSGLYIVFITDNNGCSTSDTITITQPMDSITATASIDNVNCFNGSDGSVSISASGGTMPYSFSWSSTAGNDSVVSGLIAGQYTSAITDANGCIFNLQVNVSEPPALIIDSLASLNLTCFESLDGSANVFISGGTRPYNYTWSSGSDSSSTNLLSAGGYSITVTDTNGCQVSSSIIITQPDQLIVSSIITNNVSCFNGNNGTASITLTGGTAPYSYSWSSGSTNQNTQGLIAGTYTYSAADANGCLVDTSITITEPIVLSVSGLNLNSVSCFGGNNGSATISATGGTLPYSYSWSSGSSLSSANNLSAGIYSVSVTDANQCSTSDSTFFITEPVELTTTIISEDVSCFGGNDGSATTIVTGGTAPYTYSWSNTASTNPINNLSAETYTVFVTDSNGCATTSTIIINEPLLLESSISSSTNVSCYGGSNGTATVLATGGSQPYNYSWSSGAGVSDVATGLSTGSYTVSVTDGNGCETQSIITILQPADSLDGITAKTDVSCFEGNDGIAWIIGTGGTAPYNYSWISPTSVNDTIYNLASGTYYVSITDVNGCETNDTIEINQPSFLDVNITGSINVSCYGGNNGSATAAGTGGTFPYTYTWINSSANNNIINNLTAGTYIVSMSDAKGCQAFDTIQIYQPLAPLSVSTTPTQTLCFGDSTGGVSAIASGGTAPYSYSWNAMNYTTNIISGLPAGSYTITVYDSLMCSTTSAVSIAQPQPLVFSGVAIFNINCFNSCDGAAIVIPDGGIEPYSYAWNIGTNTSAYYNGLCAGTYVCTVKDSNNCSVDTTIVISEPTELILQAAATESNCNLPIGSATVIATGGSPSYSYSWSHPAATGPVAQNLIPGTYSVEVTDTKGCKKDTIIQVTNIGQVSISASITNQPTCYNSCNATAVAHASAGNTPYTFIWNGITSTDSVSSGLCEGTTMIVVIDEDGCTDTATVQITEPALLEVTAATPDTICSGQEAILIAMASGGNGPYSYLWNGGQYTNDTISVTSTTTTQYSVMITDSNNCISAIETVDLIVRAPLMVSAANTVSVCRGEMANLFVSCSGGDGSYTYSWEPGGMTGNSVAVNPSSTQTYLVTIKDGCNSTDIIQPVTVEINEPPYLQFAVSDSVGCAPLCVQFTDLSTVIGGSITSWEWDFGSNNVSTEKNPEFCFDNNSNYNITLTATSNEGCTSTRQFVNNIVVKPNPDAAFSISPLPEAFINNAEFTFTDESKGASQWLWNFGDGEGNEEDLTMRNPSYTYSDTGTYCITLEVMNTYGCIDTTSHCVLVKPDFSFYIPNAFTPNNDGKNDFFEAKSNLITEFQMMIFDRWGSMIFTSNNIDKGWDGTVNGGNEIAQQDVYIYIVKFTEIKGESFEYTGTVTLVK